MGKNLSAPIPEERFDIVLDNAATQYAGVCWGDPAEPENTVHRAKYDNAIKDFVAGAKWYKETYIATNHCTGNYPIKQNDTCNHSCGPGDYRQGGKCDLMGCFDK
jgi:hypothetical protein